MNSASLWCSINRHTPHPNSALTPLTWHLNTLYRFSKCQVDKPLNFCRFLWIENFKEWTVADQRRKQGHSLKSNGCRMPSALDFRWIAFQAKESDCLGLKSIFCKLQAMRPWASGFASLSISSLWQEKWRQCLTASTDRIRQNNTVHADRNASGTRQALCEGWLAKGRLDQEKK